MPTIRSRILKPPAWTPRSTRPSSLNANDPFEDTETYWVEKTPHTVRRGLNANDPFEDTETRILWVDVYGQIKSQCQRSVRGY